MRLLSLIMFSGTYTALITPFRNGEVDEKAFCLLIERQIEAGITGLVPVGTTGESPTLNPNEHLRVIELAVQAAAGRAQVVAGTGANSTREAIHLTQKAEKLGVTASLQVCPYYNKPSQEGLYQHFKAVAEATSLPIMLYSIPGRSVVEIAVETCARLVNDCSNITSIKEAGGSADRVNQLLQALPEHAQILSGDDPLTLPFMSCGASGLVSVAANIIPKVMVDLVKACQAGNYKEALTIQKKYYPLFRAIMTADTNPVPIKMAAHLMGGCTEEIRRPLVALSEEKSKELKQLLDLHGLI